MKLRYYAAIVTGALAEVSTMVVLWISTGMEIAHIMAWALAAFAFAAAVVLWATQAKRKKRRHREPQIYDIAPAHDGYMVRPVDGSNGEYLEVLTMASRR